MQPWSMVWRRTRRVHDPFYYGDPTRVSNTEGGLRGPLISQEGEKIRYKPYEGCANDIPSDTDSDGRDDSWGLAPPGTFSFFIFFTSIRFQNVFPFSKHNFFVSHQISFINKTKTDKDYMKDYVASEKHGGWPLPTNNRRIADVRQIKQDHCENELFNNLREASQIARRRLNEINKSIPIHEHKLYLG